MDNLGCANKLNHVILLTSFVGIITRNFNKNCLLKIISLICMFLHRMQKEMPLYESHDHRTMNVQIGWEMCFFDQLE